MAVVLESNHEVFCHLSFQLCRLRSTQKAELDTFLISNVIWDSLKMSISGRDHLPWYFEPSYTKFIKEGKQKEKNRLTVSLQIMNNSTVIVAMSITLHFTIFCCVHKTIMLRYYWNQFCINIYANTYTETHCVFYVIPLFKHIWSG